ncbi:glycosyltransferase [Vibrio alginolyticus]|uniref:glycosyltransferase n=1 Tax=Vibrio alginolyticus TaxID=663 RepID=UPI001E285E48|nr:glycosyltransferase [Vibrio alginolyticus]
MSSFATNNQVISIKRFRRHYIKTAWPSQLLVLDDCSPDDSHEKILSLLEFAPKGLNIEYRHNTQNVGLVSQINSLRGNTKNKLIIVQAGDDIAMPNRVEETYETWLKNGKPSLIIGSYDKISEQGNIIEPFESIKQNKKPYTLENIINRKVCSRWLLRRFYLGCTERVCSLQQRHHQ